MLAVMAEHETRKTNRLHPQTDPPVRGFVALLVTMSCGAFNDNLLRGALLLAVVVGGQGMWGGELGEGGTGWITFMLYAPFIVLLGITGQIADRWSRQRVIVISRVLEVLLCSLVIWAFSVGSLMLACLSLVLMASQSALFSPAKYGIVPELVTDAALSRANGVLSMLTNSMIIAGVAASGYLGSSMLGFVMLALAVLGLVSSLCIPHHQGGNPDLQISMRTISAHVRVLRVMRGTPLMVATVAWCWFYGIGSMILALVPNYKTTLGLSDSAAGLLLAAPALGIAVGGLVAGFGSGDRIRGRLVPLGAGLMTLGLLLLGVMNTGLVGLWVLLGFTGLAAGFFVIPILALLQHLPKPEFRARCVGTANFCTYLAMAATALAYALLAPVVGNDPGLWFTVCAVLMAGVTFWTYRRREVLRIAGLHEAAMSVAAPSNNIAPIEGISIVCFDLDGTLIDATEDLTNAVNIAMEHFGKPPHTVETVGRWLGNGMPWLIHRALTGSLDDNAPEAQHTEAVSVFRKAYAESGHTSTRVLPGATDVLRMLRERHVFIVVTTNKPLDAAHSVIAALKEQLPVDAVYGGEADWPRKPDPSMLYAAREAGGRGLTVLVGDSITDRDAAAAAGMQFIAVRGGFNHGSDIADCLAPDTPVFDDLGGVKAWLEDRL